MMMAAVAAMLLSVSTGASAACPEMKCGKKTSSFAPNPKNAGRTVYGAPIQPPILKASPKRKAQHAPATKTAKAIPKTQKVVKTAKAPAKKKPAQVAQD